MNTSSVYSHRIFGLTIGFTMIGLGCLFLIPTVKAQPITSANDDTGTQINQDGNQYNIDGGSLSGDGQNLFHSFEKFGLSEGQIANFLSNPNIRNILGRVVGGEASVINGLIQVTGGNSNLFLMNPAGIIFGSGARLNVPADFTVTTATGIQFGENWFNAVGNNEYGNLVGNPSGYAFSIAEPGSILNEGNLTLEPEHNLTLLAGTVINTGELSAGNIVIAAVPGENLVRISQEGQLLNLEVSPLNTETGEPLPFNPLSLPELLTNAETGNATTVSVNEDGQIVLTGSSLQISPETGTVVASGTIDAVDTEENISSVKILGDRITLVDPEIAANGDIIDYRYVPIPSVRDVPIVSASEVITTPAPPTPVATPEPVTTPVPTPINTSVRVNTPEPIATPAPVATPIPDPIPTEPIPSVRDIPIVSESVSISDVTPALTEPPRTNPNLTETSNLSSDAESTQTEMTRSVPEAEQQQSVLPDRLIQAACRCYRNGGSSNYEDCKELQEFLQQRQSQSIQITLKACGSDVLNLIVSPEHLQDNKQETLPKLLTGGNRDNAAEIEINENSPIKLK